MPKFVGQQTGSKDIERQKRKRTSELQIKVKDRV